MVEVADVRAFLNNLPISRASDATIEKQIEIANTTVESEKGSAATQDQIEDAKLVLASWLTLGAYASQLERSVGGTPPEVEKQLRFVETVKDAMMRYVKRGGQVTAVAPVAQEKTLEKQYIDGELEGDAY